MSTNNRQDKGNPAPVRKQSIKRPVGDSNPAPKRNQNIKHKPQK